MSKVNLLLTEANGNLASSKETIEAAVKRAEEYAFLKLKIGWDIDLLVTNRLYDIVIPEDGVGGRTRTSDFIEFAINEEKATECLISEMVVHELCHAARWGKNDEWAGLLFNEIINEGIATYFEAEFAKESREMTHFIKVVLGRADEENEKILRGIGGRLDSDIYDYGDIFFKGNDILPRWAGYTVGYYLIKKYLKMTGKKIEEVFANKYEDFRVVL